MKLTVLMDNNTYIDRYYLGEPALSIYIEDGEENILFDTGCSHSGICNIVLQALEMSEQEKINGIIGGFHLLKTDQQLTETIRFLEKHTTGMLFPCHCVSLSAKLEIMKALPVTEVGVGLQMEVR